MDLTVLVCTYNRLTDVQELLDTVQSQDTAGRFTFEVIVVDNNSTDGTSAALAKRPGIQLISEKRQGKGFALQTGIAAAKGEILFVVDSDQLLPPGYLMRAWEGMGKDRNIAIYGGKVLPTNPAEVPAWLTREHWSAIGMLDMGDAPFCFGPERPVCLLVPLFRLEALRRLGGFNVNLGVSKGRIGSVEDADLEMRLVRAGYKGYYDPALVILHKIEPDRLTREHHRRWHKGHGYFLARMWDPEFEKARFRLFGVPAHLLRYTAGNLFAWARQKLKGNQEAAFLSEMRLWSSWGFIRQRLREQRPPGKAS